MYMNVRKYRVLWKFYLPQELLIHFYTAMTQCVLCTSSLCALDPNWTGTDSNIRTSTEEIILYKYIESTSEKHTRPIKR